MGLIFGDEGHSGVTEVGRGMSLAHEDENCTSAQGWTHTLIPSRNHNMFVSCLHCHSSFDFISTVHLLSCPL